MAYLIGTDEAGYGPNYGPLVISASVWRVPGDPRRCRLDQKLKAVVARARPANGEPDPRVVIADSKVLYNPALGLRMLERSLLACLAARTELPPCWRACWEALAPEAAALRDALPWYADFDPALPLEADPADVAATAERLRGGLEKAKVELLAVRSRAVFPDEFNRAIKSEGTKGAALTAWTLGLVRELLETLEQEADEEALIVCDKHGGRNFYMAQLQEQFPEYLVEVRKEGRAESIYRFGPPERRREIRFKSGGEDNLPTALASMASKYLRELAMRSFNAFWCGRIPDLRPTAGYPMDSHRYRKVIRPVQRELGIKDRLLWRNR